MAELASSPGVVRAMRGAAAAKIIPALAIALCLPACRETPGVLLTDSTTGSIYYPGTARYLMMPGVPDRPPRSKAVTASIAIIDSGVQCDYHPQLIGWCLDQKDFTGEGRQDDIGHGTVVALTLLRAARDAAHDSGLPRSHVEGLRILSAKVAGRRGIREKDVIAAINWSVERGASSVNLSLAFRGSAEEHKGLCEAIAAHEHQRVTFVVAAGNLGRAVTVFPAGCSVRNMEVIGALDDSGDHPAEYSGRASLYIQPSLLSLAPKRLYYRDEGRRLEESSQFAEARQLYSRAVDDPEVAAVPAVAAYFFCRLASVEIRQGIRGGAFEHLERAVSLRGLRADDLSQIYCLMGMVKAFQRDDKRAKSFLELALSLRPSYAQGHAALADLLLRMHDRAGALREISTAQEIDARDPFVESIARKARQGGPDQRNSDREVLFGLQRMSPD